MSMWIGSWTCECCGYRQSNFNTYCAQGCDDDPQEPHPAHPDDAVDRDFSLSRDVDNPQET